MAGQIIEGASAYVLEKFQESANLASAVFQSLPPNVLRPINGRIHYAQDKGKEGTKTVMSEAVWSYLAKPMTDNLCGTTNLWFALVFCLLHMYALNSCHFFLYLL